MTITGLIWAVEVVRLDDPKLAPSALLLATYPVSAWLYLVSLARKLDRAEAGNVDLAERPDLYLVRPVGVDCISN